MTAERIDGTAIARRLTGLPTLCTSGGVTLNCSANGRLVRSGLFDRYFFQPAASDAGAGLGAALYATHCLLGHPRGAPHFLEGQFGMRVQMFVKVQQAGTFLRQARLHQLPRRQRTLGAAA